MMIHLKIQLQQPSKRDWFHVLITQKNLKMSTAINSMRMKATVLILRTRHSLIAIVLSPMYTVGKVITEVLGACQYDFINNSQTSICEESTVEFIKKTKLFLQMELYYCGLSLEKITS